MAVRPFSVNEFRGIDNRSAPNAIVEFEERARAAATFLTEALNVDVSRDGRVRRRRGFVRSVTGDCHSLWWGGSYGFVVKDYSLGLLDEDLAFTSLAAASNRPFFYADTGAGVYMSDAQSMYRYRDGAFAELARAGTYDPTPNALDPSEDTTIYDYPPPGYILVWAFGRLWVVNEYGVFYSRGYLPDQFNLVDDYIDQPDVTLFAPVADGFYIGTSEKVQFVAGENPNAPTKVTTVQKVGAVLGSQVLTDAKLFAEGSGAGPAVVWESREGKILGLSGGNIVKLTYNRAVYPVGDRCASMVREYNGEVHHVSSIGKRDDDASNMRTTDVAVAEVIRNGTLIS